MPNFSKAEQAPVNRRQLLAGTAAVVAVACVPASAGDGVALNSISHPARAMIAAQRLWVGDIVAVSPITGNVYRLEGMGNLLGKWPYGVVTTDSECGQETRVYFGDDPTFAEDTITDTEIEDQHAAARQNATGLRINRRRVS